MTTHEDYLTIKQAAVLMNVKHRTVRNYIEKGDISPVSRINNKFIRIPRSSITKFMEKNFSCEPIEKENNE